MPTFFTPKRTEKISEVFVIVCCVIVFCPLLALCILNPSPFILLSSATYYGLAWLLPASEYMQGVLSRKENKLLWWCLSIFMHALCMVVICVMTLYTHSTSEYLTFDTTCIIAVVILLVMTPVFLTLLVFPISVFLSMDKVAMVTHQEERRPAARRITRQAAPSPARRVSRQAPSPQERPLLDTNTSPSFIPNSINTTSVLDMARSQYSSVLDRSNNMLGSMWGNTNSATRNTETVHMIQPDCHNSESESADPPNYSEVLDPELPSYDDLGAKQLQIGSKVIVVDKDFQVSSYTNV